MDEGLLDDVPLRNKERDKAWEAFIKRKDVKKMFLDDKEFNFPLNGAYYDLWSICWAKAWDKGFHAAIEKEWECLDKKEKDAIREMPFHKWIDATTRKLREKNT